MFNRKEYMKKYREGHKKEIKEWESTHKEKRNEYTKRSHNKHREKINEYAKQKAYQKGVLPMSENKKCSSFLGIYVAEKVLSRVFKNVERMPHNNRGFDFKCNKGFLVDVKSSCTHIGKGNNKWVFGINRNQIPDYFLCLAFDNRNDLNPLHLWLFIAGLVNNKFNITINESTIHKWDAYKVDIDKTIICCNILKGGR